MSTKTTSKATLEWRGLPEIGKKVELSWFYVGWFSTIHLVAFLGVAFAICFGLYWETALYVFCHFTLGQFATTLSSHRSRTHQVLKLWRPLQIVLTIIQTANFQAGELVWTVWHRLHHGHMDSKLDPHSSRWGFIHSHIAWMMNKSVMRISRNAVRVAKDLVTDPLIQWQKAHAWSVGLLLGVALPTLLPLAWVWGDWSFWSLAQGFFFGAGVRLCLQYHGTWVINSLAHSGEWKIPIGMPLPGSGSAVDPYLFPQRLPGRRWTNNPWSRFLIGLPIGLLTQLLSLLTVGEYHQASHHIADDDVRLGRHWYSVDPGKWAAYVLSWLGLASDLRTVSEERFKARLGTTIASPYVRVYAK